MSNMRFASRRGIALVAVLWALVLLSVIAAGFLYETRTETKLARNLVENAKAEALADAGVYRAVLALLNQEKEAVLGSEIERLLEGRPALREALMERPEVKRMLMDRLEVEGRLAGPRGAEEPEEIGTAGQPWRTDGTVYPWPFGGEVLISVQDEAGKIDLNAAPDELLRGLFVVLGVDEPEAAKLVAAIADFRDADDIKRPDGAEDDDYRAAGLAWEAKDRPFEAVEELKMVLGMTPELYEKAAPALTVYTGEAGIDPTVAPREVLMAVPGVMSEDADSIVAARGEGQPGAFVGLAALQDHISRPRRRAYTVRAEAHTESGAIFVREAVVEVTGDTGRPFQVRAWRRAPRSAVADAASDESSGEAASDPVQGGE